MYLNLLCLGLIKREVLGQRGVHTGEDLQVKMKTEINLIQKKPRNTKDS